MKNFLKYFTKRKRHAKVTKRVLFKLSFTKSKAIFDTLHRKNRIQVLHAESYNRKLEIFSCDMNLSKKARDSM